MGDACLKFDTPVTGGNVSFYNQSTINHKIEPVYPTPTIGMLGIIDDASKMMTIDFKNEGDLIFLIGRQNNHIGYSEYVVHIHGFDLSPAPYFNLNEEYNMQAALRKSIHEGLIESAHDVSEGGVFISLTESAMAGLIGYDIKVPEQYRKDIFLFGESQGRVVVSCKPLNKTKLLAFFADQGVDIHELGTVKSSKLVIDGQVFGDLKEYSQLYQQALSLKMDH